MTHRHIALTIERFIEDKKSGNIIINFDYQRNYVWIDSKIKSDLIKSIIDNLPIGTVLLWNTKDTNGYDVFEVIDGQQRMSTIEKFIKDEFTLDQETTENIINSNQKLIQRDAENGDTWALKILNNNHAPRFKFSQMPSLMKRAIKIYNLNIIELQEASSEQIKEYFSVVQNQEKLKAGELINAMPNNIVLELFPLDLLKKLEELLKFNDSRMDILKQLNMIVALHNKKIRMGVADKNIVSIASKLEKNLIDDVLANFFNKIKNDISNESNNNFKDTFSVFGLKLLLLSYLFRDDKFYNFTLSQKRKYISKISKLTGLFNSNDLSKTEDIPNCIYDNVKQVWKLCKTTHGRDDIELIINNDFYKIINYLESN